MRSCRQIELTQRSFDSLPDSLSLVEVEVEALVSASSDTPRALFEFDLRLPFESVEIGGSNGRLASA